LTYHKFIIFHFRLATLLILTAISVGATAVKYQCSFTEKKIWFANDTFYDCDVTSAPIERMNQKCIESISGDHLNGYTNENVRSVGIYGVKTMYMPRGLENFFSDLILIDIYQVGLSEIHQEDMQPFHNLRFLSLSGNKLKHLEDNLFINNPKLEVILLFKNQIKSVGTVFRNLINLRWVSFDNNECFSGSEKNKIQIGNLIRSIYETCELRSEDALQFCMNEWAVYRNNWNALCEEQH